MRLWYRVRSQLAEVIRVCTEQRSLTGCQARSARAQRHHIMCAWRHFVCWSRNDMIGNSVSTNSSSSSVSKVVPWRSQRWNGCNELRNLRNILSQRVWPTL